MAALEHGDNVAATARDPSTLEDLVATHPDSALALALDVADRGSAFQTVARALERFGRLDMLAQGLGNRPRV